MKKQFSLVVLLVSFSISTSSFGQNLIGGDINWSLGAAANVTNFSISGPSANNEIIQITGPHGTPVNAWELTSTGETGFNSGLNHSGIILDTNKTYRFTFWVRDEGSGSVGKQFAAYIPYNTSGTTVIQPTEGFTAMGTTTSNIDWPYFASDDLPNDVWYLAVGYIHPNSYTGSKLGGIFVQGQSSPISFTTTDFKFPIGYSQVQVRARSFMYAAPSGSIMYVYAPRIDEINGSEPTISEILSPSSPISVTGISVSPTSLSLGIGSSSTLTASLVPSNASNQNVTWSSSNSSIVTVNSSGTVNAIAEGSASITATSADGGFTATSSITVTTTPPSGQGPWVQNGNDIYFNGANVAIGRSSATANYKLAVDGHIRAREIRVDQDNWPDYVFMDGYELPSLEEIQRHIKEKGHLPNIPSAREVEANGVELGEMNKLLLEKIEELTLYVLWLHNENQKLKTESTEQIGLLIKRMDVLTKSIK